MQSLNVLISAYACRPDKGSEPGVGWNVVRELVKHHQVWVLTRENNRQSIEAKLRSNPVAGLHVVYYDFPGWATWWNHQQRGVQLHYYLWQIGAYFVARKLHQEICFDLVHHVTYVKYCSPSFLSLLSVPFIWGPVGGGESAPKAFWADFSLRGKAYEILRDLARWLGERDPFVLLTARRSVLTRATTEDTAERLRQMGATNVQVLSQLALSQEEITHLASLAVPNNSPVRFISIGRLLHWKGFHLGLRAFALSQLPDDAEYWIVGDGSERQRLQLLAKELGIAERVKFFSSLPRDEALCKLGKCLALVHPSLHDSGALVCLEAMAVGRPVLCLDLGGPAIQVTEETGIKIPASNPEQVVRELAEAMVSLANNSELRLRLGRAGQKRVRDLYAWDTKGQYLAQLYEEIIDRQLPGKGTHYA